MTKEELKLLLRDKSVNEVIDLFWPFVKALHHVQVDPKRGLYLKEAKIFHEFKKNIGQPLKEWEK